MVVQVALRNKAKEYATVLDDSKLGEYNDSIQRFDSKWADSYKLRKDVVKKIYN